jgi:hypothetical protein
MSKKIEGEIELGDRVEDKITKLRGVVIGITKWLYGCTRIVIQPEEGKDGKPAEGFNIDMPQATLVKKSVVTPPPAPVEEATPKKPGGPRNDPARGNVTTR